MDDTYDDGLVHSHGWCSDAPAHTNSARPLGCSDTAAATGAQSEEECFDDGLVHSHGWAQN